MRRERPAAVDAVRLALTTFTVLPLRAGRVDRTTAGRAMTLAPAVGALLGVLLGGESALLRLFYKGWSGHLLTGVLVVATLALLTRGMHLDGLADTVDGLGCYGGPERALAVMRQPDVGAFGVAAIVLTVVVQTAAVFRVVDVDRGTLSLTVALLTGRLAVAWACTPGTPPARPDGLGATVAGTTGTAAVAALTVLATAGAAAWGWFGDAAGATGAVRAALAVVVPLLVAHLLRIHAVRRFGGITGDVLGALVEVATTVSLVVLAAGQPHP